MSAVPPRLDIRLLGSVELRLGSAPLSPPESARAVSLLAYLLVHRGVPQPRRRVAFLLWPDSSEAQARTNLRKALHALRRALPDGFLDGDTQTLAWRTDAPCDLDLDAFERALAADDPRRAIEAYGGDLLDGSYDEWVLAERERLRDRYADALERLAAGSGDAALGYAERLVRHDPLRETGHRALMRLHAARGDRVRAMRAYHAYAAAAQRELGVVPSAAMRGAYEALLLDDDPRPPPRTAPALVGRADERARLTELWRSAERGRAQLVLVTGEPGIGKSRLVEELRSRCVQTGAVTAEARAYAAEGAVAYAPVIAWLRSAAIAPRLRRLERAQAAELAPLLPELPPSAPTSGPEQRTRLFGALAEALLAADTPLLLVADDLQWFDAPTLQFLHYLVRSAPDAPLLVAATARREELDAGHPLAELVSGLQALGRFSEIALARLGRAETSRLAASLLHAPLDAAQADRLFAASEGNPLHLVEAAQAPPHSGGRVQAMIAARLARLSAPASELAGVAATIGREFSAPVLADASRAEAPAFVRGLDELWRRGIVRAHEHDLYDFSHGRIRDAAYEQLGPAQRRDHHLRVARALERAAATDPGVLAAQYAAAGAIEDAVRWYLPAADAAQRRYDHAGAVQALERALALCARLAASRERDARELALLTALPAPLNALDGYRSERLDRVHARALDLARRLGVEPEPPLVRSRAVAALTAGDFDAARAAGAQLRARGDDVLVVEGESILGIAAYWRGRLEDARRHLEAALARWRPEHRGEHLLRYGQDTELTCRIRLAHTLWLLGHRDEAERTRDAALADAREHEHTRAIVHLWSALIALDARDPERLRAHARVVTARPAGPAERAAEALAGFVDVLDGRVAAGLERVRRAADAAEHGAPTAPGELGLVLRILVEACTLHDDAAAGVAATERALRTSNAAQPWTAEIQRLQQAFRGRERFGNGWSSTMPPTPDDLPDHHI